MRTDGEMHMTMPVACRGCDRELLEQAVNYVPPVVRIRNNSFYPISVTNVSYDFRNKMFVLLLKNINRSFFAKWVQWVSSNMDTCILNITYVKFGLQAIKLLRNE